MQTLEKRTITVQHATGIPLKQATPNIRLALALLATLRAIKNFCAKGEETAKKLIFSYVGNKEGAIRFNGEYLGDVTEGSQRRVDAELLRSKYPEIAAECTKEITFLQVSSEVKPNKLATLTIEKIETLTESAGL